MKLDFSDLCFRVLGFKVLGFWGEVNSLGVGGLEFRVAWVHSLRDAILLTYGLGFYLDRLQALGSGIEGCRLVGCRR